MGMEVKITSKIPRTRAAVELAVKTALVGTIYGIEGEAKMRAPIKTGHLRSSIQSFFPSPLVGIVSANADYAYFVEFGHHTRSGSMVAARPFLYPAAQAGYRNFQAKVAALQKALP